MSSKEAVRQILEREGVAMRYKDIVERAQGQGLGRGQVAGALKTLKKDGVVANVEKGFWRIITVTDTSQTYEPEPPNVAGLTGKEAVFQILAHIRKPAKKKDIESWLQGNRI